MTRRSLTTPNDCQTSVALGSPSSSPVWTAYLARCWEHQPMRHLGEIKVVDQLLGRLNDVVVFADHCVRTSRPTRPMMMRQRVGLLT
ncbi:MAG: hypothetical protein IPK52_20550 [Chloroflexi bacterium]|nr:hypothetical protein [Chloroflexota bacterium]